MTRGQGSLHTFRGWLKRSGGAVVLGETVALKVNETAYVFSTGSDGGFSKTLDLKPVNNNKTTFMITVSYNGSSPMNATAWTHTLNGTRYAACTTVYFGYKPSANSTTLTIDPQATQAMGQTKTQEQQQEEAEQAGWLIIWHEFTWCYPWYRLHVKIDMNPTLDLGLNPLLPGAETCFWDGLEFFGGLAEEVFSSMVLEIGGLFAAYLVARKLSIPNPAMGVALELLKLGIQAGILYFSDWASRGTRLLGSSVASILMGLLAIRVDIAKAFIDALIRLCKWVGSAMMSLFSALFDILRVEQLIGRWWMDVIEIAGDLLIGGLGIARYMGGL